MASAPTGWRLLRSASKIEHTLTADIPHFLCPAILPSRTFRRQIVTNTPRSNLRPRTQFRCLHAEAHSTPAIEPYLDSHPLEAISHLPGQCSGCGALSQTSDPAEPGFYTLTRKSVQINDKHKSGATHVKPIDETALEAAAEKVDASILESLKALDVNPRPPPSPPVCDRCHQLRHHHVGQSIHHPSIDSIHDTILESPYKHNHIYHVIDAADFPMSLIPSLHRVLEISPQRSHNRRSKAEHWHKGRKTDVSFIITRSDLLAPVKAQVDSMMPYLVETLRDALGSFGKHVRLGNVRCVSARRDWWTKDLKEDIWKRGGGGWMVGKVNVGKSRLFQSVFPKGRSEMKPLPAVEGAEEEPVELAPVETFSLLPPAPKEVNYPEMPLVHPLPGTTASPIRVPFGNGKGELVDLPGLSRGDLELHVQEEHRLSLVMRSRVVPVQQTIKPGQSLLLGGFIRITPLTDHIVLGYAFTPIKPHLTATEKAIKIQAQDSDISVENISLPGTGEKIASAGTFQLNWDATKARSGPLVRKEAAGLKVDVLPYRVVATDILIEGCGWVELVCQIRRREFEEGRFPEVEVFSPEGEFIGSRRCMSAWLLGGPKVDKRAKGRPRKSMKGAKKEEKRQVRAVPAGSSF